MNTTVYSIFKETVAKMGGNVAAQYKKDGQWQDVTWNEFDREVEKLPLHW